MDSKDAEIAALLERINHLRTTLYHYADRDSWLGGPGPEDGYCHYIGGNWEYDGPGRAQRALLEDDMMAARTEER